MSYEYMAGLGFSPDFIRNEIERMSQEEFQQVIASAREERQAELAQPVTNAPGTPCMPPEGGVTGKLYSPIPKTKDEFLSIANIGLDLLTKGCDSSYPRPYDIDNVAVCCPPGVEVPGPPAANGNGNGNGAATEEPTYFGFTPFQLGVGALGAVALYFMVLKKRRRR